MLNSALQRTIITHTHTQREKVVTRLLCHKLYFDSCQQQSKQNNNNRSVHVSSKSSTKTEK